MSDKCCSNSWSLLLGDNEYLTSGGLQGCFIVLGWQAEYFQIRQWKVDCCGWSFGHTLKHDEDDEDDGEDEYEDDSSSAMMTLIRLATYWFGFIVACPKNLSLHFSFCFITRLGTKRPTLSFERILRGYCCSDGRGKNEDETLQPIQPLPQTQMEHLGLCF